MNSTPLSPFCLPPFILFFDILLSLSCPFRAQSCSFVVLMMCKFVFSCFHSGKLDLIFPNTTKTQFSIFVTFFSFDALWTVIFLLLPSAVVFVSGCTWEHVRPRARARYEGCVVAESSNVYFSAVEKGLSLFYTLQGVLFFGFGFFSILLSFQNCLLPGATQCEKTA